MSSQSGCLAELIYALRQGASRNRLPPGRLRRATRLAGVRARMAAAAAAAADLGSWCLGQLRGDFGLNVGEELVQ